MSPVAVKTIKELIDQLSSIPGDTRIYVSGLKSHLHCPVVRYYDTDADQVESPSFVVLDVE